MDLDLSTFEPFMGEIPYRVLSRHPYDQLATFQVMAEHPQTGHIREFSALWNSSTGKLVWAPERTIAMAWRPDGLMIDHKGFPPFRVHINLSMCIIERIAYRRPE